MASSRTDSRFSVRIASSRLTRHPVRPSELSRRVSQILSDSMDQLERLGIPVQSEIHVLIEADAGILGGPRRTYEHGGMEIFSPALIDPVTGIRFPGFFGSKTLKVTHQALNKSDFHPKKILVIPFFGGEPAVFPEVIGHELGHDTFLANRQPSKIWNEARADLIAYFLTGISSISLSSPVELRQFDRDGNFVKKPASTIRDLENPRIAHLDDTIPLIDRYHENSELMAHIIWKISQRLGIPEAIELLKTIDAHAIPIKRLLPLEEKEDIDSQQKYKVLGDALKNGKKSDFVNFVFSSARQPRNGRYVIPAELQAFYRERNRCSSNGATLRGFRTNKIYRKVDTEDPESVRMGVHDSFRDFKKIILNWARKTRNEKEQGWISNLLSQLGI